MRLTEKQPQNDLSKLPVESLKGVGPSLQNKLLEIGIRTVEDIVFHLPYRYEDRTRISPIGSVVIGGAYLLEGKISEIKVMYGRRRSLLAFLEDSSGRIGLRFFYFSKRQQENLGNLKKVRCYGEVRQGATGPEIYHPEYSEAKIENKELKIILKNRFKYFAEIKLPMWFYSSWTVNLHNYKNLMYSMTGAQTPPVDFPR